MEFNCHIVNSKVVKKSDQNENSFNLIKSLNELEEPEDIEVCHPASMSKYPSCKSIFNDSDVWPSQIAKLFCPIIEKARQSRPYFIIREVGIW